MKAMVLAAGLGKRMRPLTMYTPKPLLEVSDRYLIDFHLSNLANAGIKDVVINTHWLAEKLPEALGSGKRWGLNLSYSHEVVLQETAGGIIQALPQLSDGSEPFLVVNGDVYTELRLTDWLAQAPSLDDNHLAYLGLVDNPVHHIEGDFGFNPDTRQLCSLDQIQSMSGKTYSGIGLFHPFFFKGLHTGPSQLGPLIKKHIGAGRIFGDLISDYWLDVGTPERYMELKERLKFRKT